MNTTYETIRDAARNENWTNRKIKDALFTAGMNDRRNELLAELGREKGPAPQAAAPILAPAVGVALATTKRRKFANQYAGKCELTGQWVGAGEGVCLKYGSSWCVLGPVALSVCVCDGDERKLLDAAMIAGGGEVSGLDHEDFSLLRELLAACDLEGLAGGCWSDSL